MSSVQPSAHSRTVDVDGGQVGVGAADHTHGVPRVNAAVDEHHARGGRLAGAVLGVSGSHRRVNEALVIPTATRDTRIGWQLAL